ncbi:MAG TPA: polyprenyl synthetase family protein [Solirubrobacteraceae bacterium]|jgi:geranylgeranyl pyrophosphate synthase|nr:polyprenyl synthetase family protein [Solirubrobacteraceae bacterium]
MFDLADPQAQALADELRESFEDALQAYISAWPSHHEIGTYALTTGHRTRPVGCLLACAAVGGAWPTAMQAAIAVELVHKSSVIRDDIADDDDMRSGHRAVHAQFGVPVALALSDRLWSDAFSSIAKAFDPELSSRCLRGLTDATHEMALGQLEDIAPSPHMSGLRSRLLVNERKTGVLAQIACWLGAVVGGADSGRADALGRYGRRLGTAFQVLNDVRNLSGLEDQRPAATDIRDGRETVLTAYARSEANRFVADRSRESYAGDDLGAVRRAMLDAGADDFGESLAADLMRQARAELAQLTSSPARDVLVALTTDGLLSFAF